MMNFTFIHWLLVFFLGLLALGCLVLAVRQFTVVYPIDRSNQLRRSLKIAIWAVLFSLIMILVVGVFVWVETGIFEGVFLVFIPALCLVPFVFVISAIGTYVQFFWYARITEFKDDLIQKQIERLESQDQDPPSK
jgi:hypothetical protein